MHYRCLRICCLLFLAGVVTGGTAYLWWTKAPPRDATHTAPLSEKDKAREQLAFVSLLDRIPERKPIPLGKPFSAEADNRWKNHDVAVEWVHGRRAEILKAFHERTQEFFVNSPGFGSLRMGGLNPEAVLLGYSSSSKESFTVGPPGPRDQPGSPASPPLSLGQLALEQPGREHYAHHMDNVFAFVYPWGFGYIKDRQNVAGFISHGFRERSFSTRPEDEWRIDHIQLVGVLLHERPLVYLSDKMPSMELLERGRTRELDLFEEAGLSALQSGEDLYIGRQAKALRMLGALRATKQCLSCHDAQHGDMLGAFSYVLRLASAR